jgi:hypothetical protein
MANRRIEPRTGRSRGRGGRPCSRSISRRRHGLGRPSLRGEGVCPPGAEVPEQVSLQLDAALRVGSFSRGSAESLAKELLQMNPQERRRAIEFAQPELRRLAIARILLRKAEAALEGRPRDCEEATDLAAIVAGDPRRGRATAAGGARVGGA